MVVFEYGEDLENVMHHCAFTMVGRKSFVAGTVMVCEGINLQTKTDLVHVGHGALNAYRYITQTLKPHVSRFLFDILPLIRCNIWATTSIRRQNSLTFPEQLWKGTQKKREKINTMK
jgi:hypothetical protein